MAAAGRRRAALALGFGTGAGGRGWGGIQAMQWGEMQLLAPLLAKRSAISLPWIHRRLRTWVKSNFILERTASTKEATVVARPRLVSGLKSLVTP